MKQNKCKTCGCAEFITKPNQYDIYKVIKGKVIFERTESVNEDFELFCRDCSEKLEIQDELRKQTCG